MTNERMSREEAIEYLERKGRIGKPIKPAKTTPAKYDKADEQEISTVQKEGRIYGDPIAHVQW